MWGPAYAGATKKLVLSWKVSITQTCLGAHNSADSKFKLPLHVSRRSMLEFHCNLSKSVKAVNSKTHSGTDKQPSQPYTGLYMPHFNLSLPEYNNSWMKSNKVFSINLYCNCKLPERSRTFTRKYWWLSR